jgi:protein TonB
MRQVLAFSSRKRILCLTALILTAGRVAAAEPEPRLEDLPAQPNVSSLDAAQEALKLYTIDVYRAIGRAVSQGDYPREARERGWQGLTKVRVKIGADGATEDVTVSQSSGYSMLDDIAVSKVRTVPLPEIPKDLRDRAFTLDVPFRFKLRTDSKGPAEEKGLVLPSPSLK